jgi:hypothetical protein
MLRFKRPPDFTIGRTDDAYMHRWYIIPRNRWFNIYLHNMKRDDDDVGLHDHPWWNISIVLKGGYWELMPQYRPLYPNLAIDVMTTNFKQLWRRPGSIIFRRATDAHRLELAVQNPAFPMVAKSGRRRPSWSLFITGRNKRTWGFWCKDGWRPHTAVVRKTDTGNEVGFGCG